MSVSRRARFTMITRIPNVINHPPKTTIDVTRDHHAQALLYALCFCVCRAARCHCPLPTGWLLPGKSQRSPYQPAKTLHHSFGVAFMPSKGYFCKATSNMGPGLSLLMLAACCVLLAAGATAAPLQKLQSTFPVECAPAARSISSNLPPAVP